MARKEKRPKIGTMLIHDGEHRMMSDEHLISSGRAVTIQIVGMTQSCIRVYRHKVQEEKMDIAPIDFLVLASKFKGGQGIVEDPRCFDGQIRARITGNRMARIQLVETGDTEEEVKAVSDQIELTLDEMNYLVGELQTYADNARNGRV